MVSLADREVEEALRALVAAAMDGALQSFILHRVITMICVVRIASQCAGTILIVCKIHGGLIYWIRFVLWRDKCMTNTCTVLATHKLIKSMFNHTVYLLP